MDKASSAIHSLHSLRPREVKSVVRALEATIIISSLKKREAHRNIANLLFLKLTYRMPILFLHLDFPLPPTLPSQCHMVVTSMTQNFKQGTSL